MNVRYAYRKGIWTDRDGKEHKISKMRYDYLLNIRRFLNPKEKLCGTLFQTNWILKPFARKKRGEIEEEITRRVKSSLERVNIR